MWFNNVAQQTKVLLLMGLEMLSGPTIYVAASACSQHRFAWILYVRCLFPNVFGFVLVAFLHDWVGLALALSLKP